VELEHQKIKTTLIDEMFASVMGEYLEVMSATSKLSVILGCTINAGEGKKKGIDDRGLRKSSREYGGMILANRYIRNDLSNSIVFRATIPSSLAVGI
jgi:hypothetical protein